MRSICFCLAGVIVLGAKAQSGPGSPAFEAASIRLHQMTAPAGVPETRNGPLVVSSSLIRLTGYTVFGLVMDAWDLRDFQVAPAREVRMEDLADTTYDIVGRAPGDRIPAMDEVRAMLRALLEERFQLKVHHESRPRRVYALVSAKRGPGLKEGTGGAPCAVRVRMAEDGRNSEFDFTNCDIDCLADELGHLIQDRPVLNRSGLQGRYDFRLVAIPWYRARGRSDPADIDPLAAVARLGLKLVSQQAKIDVLVIDRLEKPDEN